MRYVVCFLILPFLPSSAFLFPSSMPIDRIYWGVLLGLLTGAMSARYAWNEGGTRGTAAAYGITTALLSFPAFFLVLFTYLFAEYGWEGDPS
jgi:drug/metabolite transporter (DMT)-like permease